MTAVGLSLSPARTRSADLPSPPPFISIVMPCLDEQATVAICVTKARRWLESRGFEGEVLVIDNGCRDDSPRLAEATGARTVPKCSELKLDSRRSLIQSQVEVWPT